MGIPSLPPLMKLETMPVIGPNRFKLPGRLTWLSSGSKEGRGYRLGMFDR